MALSFKSWDTPANGTWAGKYVKKPSYSSSSRITSWRDLDWARLFENCTSAVTIATAEANASRLESYKAFIHKKEQEEIALNPETGSFEGNMSERYPLGPMPMEIVLAIRQKATVDILENFCETNNLKNTSAQLLPLIITFLAGFKLTDVSGEEYNPVKAEHSYKSATTEGLISSQALYKQIFTDEVTKGLHYFIMYDTKSNYLETQYKGPAKNFCSLVPLILYAFKLIKGVPYRHWNKEDIRAIVNPKLADAMLYSDPKPSHEDIIEARNVGLSVKSGSKVGTMRNPVYTFKLYGKTPISHLPDYAQVMYAQIWCAHPENRTKYMILDPANWDNMPEPLISSEVTVEGQKDSTEFTFDTKSSASWL